MARPRRSFWETYFRTPTIFVNGVELPLREALNFTFSLAPGNPTVEDDEENEWTEIPLSGWLGLEPAGDDGDMQFKAGDQELGGTGNLRVESDEIVHGGKPLHKEDWSDFVDADEPSFARSQWKVAYTSNATETTLATISIPAATHGDCFVTVHAEITYFFASSATKGGTLAMKATFKRSSGTLTRIGTQDLTLTGLATGTAPGGMDVDVSGNDDVIIQGTGIASTNITWVVSMHIQLARAAA